MSSTLQKPEPATLPQPAVLVDRLPEAVRLPRVAIGFVVLLGIVFWTWSFQPLHHTDLWGHLAYGKLIWETHGLPATEPLMPLAEGVPLIDTAWLSQLIGYGAQERWGLPAMQFLHAAVITACFALLSWSFYVRTKNVALTLMGLAAFAVLNWQQFLVVRPQLAGLLCYVTLMVVLASRRWRRINWLMVPLLFALWANLHGSFVVGLGLLGCCVAGRAIDVWRRTHRLTAAWHDSGVRRLFLLSQLAIAACLLNPYGWGLFMDVLTFASNPNLADLIEWDPLQIRTWQGKAAAATALALVFAYRLSPRRVSAMEVLAVVLFGVAALWSSRMLIWWTPLAVFALVWHTQAAWRHARPLALVPGPSPRSSLSTFVGLGLSFLFFAFTPFGLTVLHGRPVDMKLKHLVSDNTPLGAVEYLTKNPPQGQIFNTYEWGDYLVWAGPANMKVFVTSHAHLVPREVWRSYISVIHVAADWDDILDRYGVNTIVVDKQDRGALIGRLKDDARWKRAFEDDLAVIYVRNEQI